MVEISSFDIQGKEPVEKRTKTDTIEKAKSIFRLFSNNKVRINNATGIVKACPFGRNGGSTNYKSICNSKPKLKYSFINNDIKKKTDITRIIKVKFV